MAPRRTTGFSQTQSKALFRKAKRFIPGGVNSPVRAFGSVGGTPPFIESGKGARITDVDGNTFIDYVGSWGPLILGHADAGVLRAVKKAASAGTSFGAPTGGEVEIAERVCAAVPSIEQVRFVSSGTEATMSAIRLALGATDRKKILKFAGCYHGHSDALLVGAGSGVATLGIPGSPGVPEEFVKLTLQAPFNDLSSVASVFKHHGDDLACVLVEPVAGNMGCILPLPGFLQGLRDLCDRHGVLLIFDEVMTGFRVAWGRRATALQGEARPDDPRQGDRRGVAGGGLRREPGTDEPDRARRSRLSGRDLVRKSVGGGVWPGDPQAARGARNLRGAFRDHSDPDRGLGRPGRGRRDRVHHRRAGWDVRILLSSRACTQF